MSKFKKVLAVFGNVAFFGQERGNIEVFSLLKNAGHDVLLAVNEKGFHWHLQNVIEERELKYKKMVFSWNFRKTLQWKHIKGYLINIPKSNFQLYKLIKRENPDVIHVCNDTHVISLLPILLWTNKKIIYRLGDKPTAYLSKMHEFIWRRLIIPRINHFVCISRFIGNSLIDLGCEPIKITQIYNYPPRRDDKPDHAVPTKMEGVITFTFIGQLTKEKGVDLLVMAFLEICKTSPNCRLFIAGEKKYNLDMVNKLSLLASQSAYGNKILLLGKVDNINQLLKNSDINIIPSVYPEPLSNVIVEAKANSIASVVFPSGGLPELVEHKKNGYITKQKTVDDLVEAMNYYLTNKSKIQEHGMASYNSLMQYGINYDSFTKNWLKVYE